MDAAEHEWWRSLQDGDWGGALHFSDFEEAKRVARKLAVTMKITTKLVIVRHNGKDDGWGIRIPSDKAIKPEVVRAACNVVRRELYQDESGDEEWAMHMYDPDTIKRDELYALDERARYEDVRDPYD